MQVHEFVYAIEGEARFTAGLMSERIIFIDQDGEEYEFASASADGETLAVTIVRKD